MHIFNWTLYRRYVKETLPVGAILLIQGVSLRIDIVLLAAFRSSEEVGYFTGPYRMVDAVAMLSIVLVTALFPVMARQAGKDEQINRTVRKAIKLLLAVAIPISLGLIVLASSVLRLFLGSDFSPAAPVLQLLAIVIAPIFVNHLLAFAFISVNRQADYAVISGIALVINIVLDLILIPLIGYWGACIGTLCGEGFRFTIGYARLQNRVGSLGILRTVGVLALPSIVMMIVLLFLTPFSWIIAAILGFGAYIAALFFSGALESDERKLINKAFGRAS